MGDAERCGFRTKGVLRGDFMTDKELRRLSRAGLLELLLEQRRENERLRAQLKKMQRMLNDRRIELENAGSIAEAALKLSGVFEAAQEAADQYLDNMKRRAKEAEARREEDAEASREEGL